MGSFRCGTSVAVDTSEVIGPVPVREVKEISAKLRNRAVGNHAFVNGALPVRNTSIEQTDLAIRIPAGMIDPCSEIRHAPGHRSRGRLRREALPFHDFTGQFDTGSLIGVDTENPVVLGMFCAKVLLTGKAFPCMNDYACSTL
jgi:hypothetical protein